MPRDEAPTTLHYRVRSHLLDLIKSGGVREGDQLPTEKELQEKFGVSRITVRNAVSQLAAMGLVVRQPGRGTFVAQTKIEQELGRLTSFVEDMQALGFSSTARVVQIREVPAPAHVAACLNIKSGSPVVYMERVRLGNNEPLSLDVSYMPIDIGHRISKEDLVNNPIFSLLENKYQIALGEANYMIEASVANEDIARQLEINPGDPVLLIERRSYATDGRPLMQERLHYRGDRMRYRMRVRR